MYRALLLAGACLVVAAPAFAQSPQPESATPPGAAEEKAQPQAETGTPSTGDFVKMVAISDMFEIQSSKLALEKKTHGDIHFAEHMIHDHSKTSAQLGRLVKSGDVKAELPTQLDAEHQGMLDQLRHESGAGFAKDYDQAQLKGHKEAVALFQKYAQGGDNPKLKRWAADTLPKLLDHLAMAEKLSSR
jgi:putative membrane protein